MKNTKEVMKATCNKAAGRNFLYTTFGRYLFSVKVAYLSSRDKTKNSIKDDIMNMIQDFKVSDRFAFTSISDVPID